jgi:hypothetical protein
VGGGGVTFPGRLGVGGGGGGGGGGRRWTQAARGVGMAGYVVGFGDRVC